MATFTTSVSGASVAANPNTAMYQSYSAGEYAAPRTDATFSTGLFDQTWKPVQNAQGQSQYDVSRAGQEAASQRDAQIRAEALRRQFSGQGLSGSGIEIKQSQIGQVQRQQSLQSGLAGINIAELGAAEQSRNAALQRQYGAQTLGVQNEQQTGERLGAQAFEGGQQTERLGVQKELTYADLTLREQQISNQASQFTSDLEFRKWATERGYTDAEAQRAWQSHENSLSRTSQEGIATAGNQTGITIANINASSSERISLATIASNERINANRDALTAAGIDVDKARVYGYTDPATGQHVMGSVQIAAAQLGLTAVTIQDQKNELWGWTDAQGVHHAGKYELLSAEDKRAADALYGGVNPVTGAKIRGSLENDALIADLKAREVDMQHDSFYGYTDDQGNVVMGSGEIAAKAFGLQAKSYEDQAKELYGYYDKQTGRYITGKLEALSNDDKRTADELYGYIDANTGVLVAGTLQLQADQNAIQRQGLTIEEARVKGYRKPDGTWQAGSLQLEQEAEANKKTLMILDNELQEGRMDKQAILDADALVTKAKADRYYLMGKNGEPLSPQALAAISKLDPLAYQSYLMGQQGATEAELARSVEMTNQYRAAQITNMDDPAVQQQITAMFASWGDESAAQQLEEDQANPINVTAKDFTTYESGHSVLLNADTTGTNGTVVPAGSYTVLKEDGTQRGAWDGMKQDWLTEKGTVTYLVDANNNRIQVGFEVTSTEKEGTWWDNCANPLSKSFWQHPFGLGK